MGSKKAGRPPGESRVAILPRAVHLQRCRMPGWHGRCPRYQLWRVSNVARFGDFCNKLELQKIHQHLFSDARIVLGAEIELIKAINGCKTVLEEALCWVGCCWLSGGFSFFTRDGGCDMLRAANTWSFAFDALRRAEPWHFDLQSISRGAKGPS